MKIKPYRMRQLMTAGAIVLFLAALIWFLIAINRTESAAEGQQRAGVEQLIENAVTLCYSLEGAYPESLEYLTEGYGVHYDTSRYIVHYDCFAANIRPTVTVIERER